MRARVLIAAGLVTSLAAACSRPSGDVPPAETEAARDITLVPTTDEPAVVSALEAPVPGPAPEPSRAPARQVRGTPEPIGRTVAAEPLPAAHANAGEPSEPVAWTTHPRMDDSPQPESGPSAGASGGGKPSVPMTGAGRVPDIGRGPILVRGGEATIDDDCAHHMPPRIGEVRPEGNAGVLINDRAPRRGPPQTIADRTPRGPSFGGRGGIR